MRWCSCFLFDKWFDTVEAISFLLKRGYQISKYEIEDDKIETSNSQIIFKKGHETFIEKTPYNINNLTRKNDYKNLNEKQLSYFYTLGI